jgi:hypothetical protein
METDRRFIRCRKMYLTVGIFSCLLNEHGHPRLFSHIKITEQGLTSRDPLWQDINSVRTTDFDRPLFRF